MKYAFEGAVFKDVVTDINELSTVVGSLPSITEWTVGEWIPSVVGLGMIGQEHMVDGAGFVISVCHAFGDLSVGVFLALYAVAIGVE